MTVCAPSDVAKWKTVALEYGDGFLDIAVPPATEEITMGAVAVLPDPGQAIARALEEPIGCPPLEAVIAAKGKSPERLTVAVTVSDITRPVPYAGTEGILGALLPRLLRMGIPRERIVLVIGNGMHRPSTEEERIAMFGADVVDGYCIIDHDCEDLASLEHIGKTRRGRDVYVNRAFYQADVRIGTGLVESHFMVGVSGGRKSVCPGLVDKRTIEKFHSPAFLESPLADNLILEGNPCHEESLEIARTVGVDFIVNVTLNRDMKITGVFAGHLEAAHEAAYRFVKGYAAVPVRHPVHIVLTHGGYVGRNHYQAVKAAYNALPVLREGGTIVLAADNRDAEPIGGPEYKSLLHLLKIQGHAAYLKLLDSPHWTFTKDQWEPEMWGKVLRKVGEEGLVYCTLAIPRADHCIIPGRCGLDYLPAGEPAAAPLARAQAMVQNALFAAVEKYRDQGVEPAVAFVREGPYAVPFLRAGS